MLISHKHKFIFLKTPKTAGTTTEILLSAICGHEDVITPVTKKDEQLRREFCGRNAQNFKPSFWGKMRGERFYLGEDERRAFLFLQSYWGGRRLRSGQSGDVGKLQKILLRAKSLRPGRFRILHEKTKRQICQLQRLFAFRLVEKKR